METSNATSDHPVIAAIVAHFSILPTVRAIVLGGSRATASAATGSDVDVYVFTTGDIPFDVRAHLARQFDPDPEIGHTWFGPGDEWTDRVTGTAADIMFWQSAGFEADLRQVIEHHRPALGYTTAFWFTIRNATPLFDRDGWLQGIKLLARTPYPPGLTKAIIAWNHPLLRTTQSSLAHQIEIAIQRDDPISVNHRIAALLASVTDISFALHSTLHPGEKRLLAALEDLGADGERIARCVRRLLAIPADPPSGDTLSAAHDLCDTLDDAIRTGGLGNLIGHR